MSRSGAAIERSALNVVPAPLLVILAVLFIQLGTGVAKGIVTPQNAYNVLFVRLVLGSGLLLVGVRPRVTELSRRQWLDAVLLGIVFGAFNLAVYRAFQNLPLGLVATIGFLGPLTVSLMNAGRPLDLLWPILGGAGVFLLTPWSGTDSLSLSVVGYGLTYAATWAVYILASARAGRTLPGVTGFVLANPIAAVIVAPLGLAGIGPFFRSDAPLGAIVLITICATLPFALEFMALKRLAPRVFGVLLSLEPGIATMIGWIVLREELSAIGWLALILVSVASFGAAFTRTENMRSGCSRLP